MPKIVTKTTYNIETTTQTLTDNVFIGNKTKKHKWHPSIQYTL